MPHTKQNKINDWRHLGRDNFLFQSAAIQIAVLNQTEKITEPEHNVFMNNLHLATHNWVNVTATNCNQQQLAAATAERLENFYFYCSFIFTFYSNGVYDGKQWCIVSRGVYIFNPFNLVLKFCNCWTVRRIKVCARIFN